jgi:hypothetical protein
VTHKLVQCKTQEQEQNKVEKMGNNGSLLGHIQLYNELEAYDLLIM